ncbi:MAG: SCP2 sterol-binding domain-containing protein [Acidobacteriota bacterium]|nr:SCP2 sterol-binding domain-containing protein [Acidobacteriota bacterium]
MSETAAALKEIFDKMPENIDPSAVEGLDCVIQHDLGGDDGGQYYATIKDGACSVTEGRHDSPTMTLTMQATDFVALSNGSLDGMSAFMSGKLKIGGDMGLAMKLQSLFSG